MKLGVRNWLLALALAAMLPLLLFAGFTANRLTTAEREATLAELVRRTESAANVVERYLQSQRTLAVTLAATPMLQSGDLAGFYNFAKQAMDAGKIGRSVALADPTGKMLLNTRRPMGTTLPPAGDVQGLAETLTRKTALIGNLYRGAVSNILVFTVWAPVTSGAQLSSLVGVTLEPQDLTAILREERLPDGWFGVVIDRQNIIVARTLAPEAFVGQKIAPRSEAQIQGGRGVSSFVTLEGTSTSASYIKLPETGWTVAIGVPKGKFEASARNSFQFMLALGVAALTAAGVLAFLVGRIVSGQAAGLAHAALSLGEGIKPAVRRSGVRELDDVAGALSAAHDLIRKREVAFRESEARLRSILEAANVIAWEADINTDNVHTVGPSARLFDKPDDF